MNLLNIQRHGMLCQKVRAAENSYDMLKAVQEYKQFMDEVEADMFSSYQREKGYQLGKTAD